MVYRRVLFVIAVLFSLVLLESICPTARSEEPELVRPDSRPQLVCKIRFAEYGSKYARLGDLTGNGLPEMLLVQVTAAEG